MEEDLHSVGVWKRYAAERAETADGRTDGLHGHANIRHVHLGIEDSRTRVISFHMQITEHNKSKGSKPLVQLLKSPTSPPPVSCFSNFPPHPPPPIFPSLLARWHFPHFALFVPFVKKAFLFAYARWSLVALGRQGFFGMWCAMGTGITKRQMLKGFYAKHPSVNSSFPHSLISPIPQPPNPSFPPSLNLSSPHSPNPSLKPPPSTPAWDQSCASRGSPGHSLCYSPRRTPMSAPFHSRSPAGRAIMFQHNTLPQSFAVQNTLPPDCGAAGIQEGCSKGCRVCGCVYPPPQAHPPSHR